MAPHSTYSRKLYVIDKEFQFGYLMSWLMMVLGTVGGLVLATLAMFFFFRGSLFQYSMEIDAGLAVIFTGLSLYYMVRHSHRIAGPAYDSKSSFARWPRRSTTSAKRSICARRTTSSTSPLPSTSSSKPVPTNRLTCALSSPV